MSWSDKAKKILPYVGVGLGVVLILLVSYSFMKKRSGASVLAPLSDPDYGTATASGIPWLV